ncbi:polyprenyl synthetase family protein [Comamonas serinivorans]|nr:farnesyl diphosphate synthase [Comamonas serinivorans]
MPEFNFSAWMHQGLAQVEQGLARWVGEAAPTALRDAMRYAVLDGGKRLRPLLVLAAAQAAAQADDKSLNEAYAIRAACAVELIHAYSLVHDDMPCMDNDLLRRGKPTVHVQFGEAMALLAGDALQALAFELLTPEGDDALAGVQARLCRALAVAAGGQGMAGGQAIDLTSVGKALSEDQLKRMHEAKTGALLKASVHMGWLSQDPAPDQAGWPQLERYGHAVGLAFQVVDDILDVTADSATLGKTAGKDAQDNKPTYVSILGLEASRAYAGQLRDQALSALAESHLPDVQALRELALMVVDRQH